MLAILKKSNRLSETVFLAVITFVCISFSAFRIIQTDTTVYLFLNWNLFLAILPWALTSFAIIFPKCQENFLFLGVLLCSWLLFFPNAPYILTDLFHLRANSSMPIWYDLILILSFAWTGLLYGFLSLSDIENILHKKFSASIVSTIVVALLFISSFGIYLGRYLRWNSWDILMNPLGILFDIGDRVINPFEHPRTWGMTLFMGVFLNIIYWSFKLIGRRNTLKS